MKNTMTLYLKYRPQTIEELDLSSVRESLTTIIKSGKIPHALLFSGPKGTGKTSAARILAKVINCESPANFEPCNKCAQCVAITKGSSLDVIEMDAASNRGIDDIRSLREAVKLSPVSARTKIYIVDEAHMLTTEAANAFLKTLEEPPSHVVFILATTNPEKLIPTVRSRLTSVVFPRAKPAEIKRQLRRVVDGEKWQVEEDALDIIATASEGSFRDAVKILEQAMADKLPLSVAKARSFVIQNTDLDIEEFVSVIAKSDTKEVIDKLELLMAKGGSIIELIDKLILCLHESLLAKFGVTSSDNLAYLTQEETVSLLGSLIAAQKKYTDSPLPQLSLEMELVAWKKNTTLKGPGVSVVKNVKHDINQSEKSASETMASDFSDLKFEGEMWQKVLLGVRNKNVSVEALLRSSKPLGFDGKNLRLGVYYKFHKERLEVATYRRTLEDVIESVVGTPVRIVCTLTEPPAKAVTEEIKVVGNALTESMDVDIMEAAKEIFGN